MVLCAHKSRSSLRPVLNDGYGNIRHNKNFAIALLSVREPYVKYV